MIEQKIDQLIAAIGALIQVMQSAAQQAPAQPGIPHTPPPPATTNVVQMPTPPFQQPAAAPAPMQPPPVAPFSDTQGLLNYAMAAYQAMGPAKGAQIQNILTQMGYANINDVPADKFATIYAQIEQLKLSA